MQGRPGPVVLALPEDMLTTPTAAPVLPRVEPAQAWPAPGALRDLRALLLAAERPFVIAGGSGWDAEAARALQRFAENWQLPVGCGFRFQDTFDNRHPLYAGDVGIGINPKLAQRMRDADLVIALGVRLGEMTTGGYTLLAGAAAAAAAGAHPRRRRGTGPRLCRRPDAAGRAWPARPRRWRRWPRRRPCPGRAGPQRRACRLRGQPRGAGRRAAGHGGGDEDACSAWRPADTVYTNGAGNFSGWLHRYVRYSGLQHHGRTQLAPTSGAMGYGVPAAVAAALLQPERTVVNIAGDGDFLMTGQELATATGYGADQARPADQHGRRQRQLRHDPHAPGARVPGARQRQRAVQPRLRGAGARLSAGARARRAHRRLRAGLRARRWRAGAPMLIHLKLDADVSTTRTTLAAIRDAARQAGR